MSTKKQDILVINDGFSDVKPPEFKVDMLGGWVNYGADNNYPAEPLLMFNKSAKNGAIIGGKLTYIYGGGLKKPKTAGALKFWAAMNGRLTKMIIFDIETFGGCYIECIPKLGGGYKYSHMSFERMRSNDSNSKFFYKTDWSKKDREGIKTFPAFFPGTTQRSIFYFKEYRPGIGTYPLPGYFPASNYIMADIEVSRHTYSNAKGGFSASKLVSFFNGEPTPEQKNDIENRFGLKHEGPGGKKTILSFNLNKEQAPQIDDLGASDLTKEDFTAVDNLITSNIYSGHQITNPALFGIQTPGKLGVANEIRESYEVFNNTYAKFKREQVEGILRTLAQVNGVQEDLTLIDSPPLGITLTDSMIAGALTKKEIKSRLGLDTENDTVENPTVLALLSLPMNIQNSVVEKMTANEVRALIGLAPVAGGDVAAAPETPAAPVAPVEVAHEAAVVNEHIKNLNGAQRRNMLSIVNQHSKGRITRDMAAMLLKNGLGFTDIDVTAALGPAEEKKNNITQAFGAQLDPAFLEVFTANLFDTEGTGREEFVILSTKEATFDINDEVKETFAAGAKLGTVEAQIISILETDPKQTRGQISEALSTPIEVINKAFEKLVRDKVLKIKGGSYIILKKPPKLPKKMEALVPKIEVRYSYEVRPGIGPEIKKTTRPFCKKMCELNRLYLRQDIEKISRIVGYSVWDRRGGFWRKPDGSTSESCRHYWAMHVVTKKEK